MSLARSCSSRKKSPRMMPQHVMSLILAIVMPFIRCADAITSCGTTMDARPPALRITCDLEAPCSAHAGICAHRQRNNRWTRVARRTPPHSSRTTCSSLTDLIPDLPHGRLQPPQERKQSHQGKPAAFVNLLLTRGRAEEGRTFQLEAGAPGK